MFEEQSYKAVFSKVRASAQTHRIIRDMEPESKSRRAAPLRKAVGTVLAAVLVMMLSVTAFAAVTGAEWFDIFFREGNEVPLSESQVAYIHENTVDISRSVTHEGYTVSVECAISDGYTLYMNVKLTAPEGVVLNADDYGFVYQNRSQFYPADGSNPARSGSWHMVNDDPNDNTVYFPMKWQGEGLHIGSKWILDLTDVAQYQQREDGSLEETILAKGNFRFEITIAGTGDYEVELLEQPLAYTAKVYDSDTEYREVEIALTSVVLRPMSANIKIEGWNDTFRLAGFAMLKVVMKDGTAVEMTMRSGGNGENGYSLSAPVIMEEVDHILLPDGTGIPMPALEG